MTFFGWLMQIASLEAIPTDWIYSFLSDEEGLPYSESFEELGLEHHLFMNNAASLGFVTACLPLLYILHSLTQKCNNCRCCQNFSKRLGPKLYYGVPLRTLIEGYVIFFISCLINIQHLDIHHPERWTQLNAYLSVMVMFLLILFPVISVIFMLKNR